jgi:hypothetical protein
MDPVIGSFPLNFDFFVLSPEFSRHNTDLILTLILLDLDSSFRIQTKTFEKIVFSLEYTNPSFVQYEFYPGEKHAFPHPVDY